MAERLLQSQATNAILTTFNEVNMAPVMEMRKRFQERFEKEHGVKIGFMSFFVKAAVEALREVPQLRFFGTPRRRAGVVSFLVGDIHPHDLATIIDRHGVAVRAGHHCAQPVMKRFGVAATVRASFGVYSSRQDVDALVRALHAAREVFA